MPSLTEQLFGASSATAAAGPSTGLGFGAAASPATTEQKPSAGKKKKAAADGAAPEAAAEAKKAKGLAGFAAAAKAARAENDEGDDAKPDLFRKVAPPAEPVAPVKGSRRKAAATGEVPEEEAKKRKKHLSHLHDEQDPDEVRRTVFISNLPNSMRLRPDIAKHFKDCGEIENVRVRCLILKPTNGEKQRGRGVRVLRNELLEDDKMSAVAYILFKRASSVDLALAQSGSVFKGRHITVAREERESKAFLPKYSVFLGNLSYDVADEDVWNYFLERGIKDVDRVRVLRDRDTGRAKGIGYVGFRSSASVKRAIAEREHDLCGRPLRICHVQKPKDPKLQVTSATRREMRRLKHQKSLMELGPDTVAEKKLNKKAKAAAARAGGSESGAGKTSGRREEAATLGIDAVPAWMGSTTNPRKKLPKELRVLTQSVEDRKKAITEKRKANQERVREKRKAEQKRGPRPGRGGNGGGDN